MEIFDACAAGDVEAVRAAVDADADLGARDDENYTPLHRATSGGHLEVVRILLDAGAEIDALAEDAAMGGTALQMANYAGHEEVGVLLIERGANPDLRGDEYEEPPLSVALDQENWDIARALVEAGAELVWKDEDGEIEGSALHVAARADSVEVELIAMLIDRDGVDVNLADQFGETALGSACSGGGAAIVRLLLEAGASLEPPEEGTAPILEAIQAGNTTIVGLLLERGASATRSYGGLTPLDAALAQDDLETALLLAKAAGVDPAHDPRIERLEVIDAASRGATDQLTRLLDRGAGIDAKNAAGCGVLHVAARHAETLRLLLARGAEVDMVNDQRETALLSAVESGELDSVTVLLEAGADPRHKDRYRQDALLTACRDEIDVDLIAVLLEHGADPNAWDYGGQTAVHLAAQRGDPRALAVLLAAGGQPQPDSGAGPRGSRTRNSPLHEVFDNDEAEEADVVAACKLLLDTGADPNAKNADRRTAAHLAVLGGRPEALELLISRGADPFARARRNRTPLDELEDAGLGEDEAVAIRKVIDPHGALG